MRQNGNYSNVNIEVTPLETNHCLLVIFEESGPTLPKAQSETEASTKGQKTIKELRESHLQLQQELSSTKDYLQSIIEDKEASNEELKAANEEIQSSNEELQSTNEELETAKEELQATNEELNTINEELHHRNVDLVQVNDDLLNLLGNINVPILMTSNELRLRRINPQAEREFGVQSTDIGSPVTTVKFGIDFPDLKRFLSSVIADMAPREVEVLDDKNRWRLLSARPYRTADNRIEGLIIILYDIDMIKRTEQIYKKKYEDYAQIATEQSTKLNEATRLMGIGEAAGMIGHDLRNPLQTILNTVHIAKGKIGPNSLDNEKVEEISHLLENVHEQAVYMNKVVSDLQDYARTLKPTMTDMDVNVLLKETLNSLAVPENISVSLRPSGSPISIKADKLMMRRVLTNLATNAIDAMPRGGSLAIETAKGEKTVAISVIDNGEGITEQALPQIFSPFHSTKASGTGLGLAVAKRLVEAQGATITVNSQRGKGTVFRVDIPLADDESKR